MRPRSLILAALIAGMIFAATPAKAAGIPVIDSSSLAQTIAQLKQSLKDYEQQLQQVATMKSQLETQIRQFQAMTGAKGVSSILNTSDIKNLRLSAPDLNSVLDAAINGGSIGGQSSKIKEKIDQLKSVMDLSDLKRFADSTKPRDKATAQLAGSGLAAVAMATDGFEKADKAAQRVTQLIDGIDSQTDLKASIDYNTRVQAEVASLLVEMLRVQAANANANGMAQTSQARDILAGRKRSKIGEKDITQ